MSTEYHKINAPFMRDSNGVMIYGAWCMPELAYLADNEWEFTEKVDGTNIRLTFNPYGGFHIAGRTDNAQTPKPLLEALQDLCLEVAPSVRSIMHERKIDELTVYGEGYGPKINGGGRYNDTPDFVAFDIKVGDFWLKREDINDFCRKTGVDVVPIVGHGTLHRAMEIVRGGLRSEWGDFEAEGLVAVPVVPLFDRAGRRIITKVKARDFK